MFFMFSYPNLALNTSLSALFSEMCHSGSLFTVRISHKAQRQLPDLLKMLHVDISAALFLLLKPRGCFCSTVVWCQLALQSFILLQVTLIKKPLNTEDPDSSPSRQKLEETTAVSLIMSKWPSKRFSRKKTQLTWQPSADLRNFRTEGDIGAAPVTIIRTLPPMVSYKWIRNHQIKLPVLYCSGYLRLEELTWTFLKTSLSKRLSFRIMPCFTSIIFIVAAKFNRNFFTGVFAPLCICRKKNGISQVYTHSYTSSSCFIRRHSALLSCSKICLHYCHAPGGAPRGNANLYCCCGTSATRTRSF